MPRGLEVVRGAEHPVNKQKVGKKLMKENKQKVKRVNENNSAYCKCCDHPFRKLEIHRDLDSAIDLIHDYKEIITDKNLVIHIDDYVSNGGNYIDDALTTAYEDSYPETFQTNKIPHEKINVEYRKILRKKIEQATNKKIKFIESFTYFQPYGVAHYELHHAVCYGHRNLIIAFDDCTLDNPKEIANEHILILKQILENNVYSFILRDDNGKVIETDDSILGLEAVREQLPSKYENATLSDYIVDTFDY